MIEIGKIGKIISGDDKGWELKIVDDDENTGGFLVLTSKDFSNPQAEAYDAWVDSKQSLEKYFKESNWIIEWNQKT